MVFLGWVLGMFSIWITEAAKNWKNRVETEKAIQTELDELRLKLLASINLLRNHLGTFDRALLNWMMPIVAKYKGLMRVPPSCRLWRSLQVLMMSNSKVL